MLGKRVKLSKVCRKKKEVILGFTTAHAVLYNICVLNLAPFILNFFQNIFNALQYTLVYIVKNLRT